MSKKLARIKHFLRGLLEEKAHLVFGSTMHRKKQKYLPGGSLISLERARRIVSQIQPLEREKVVIEDGVGRITAGDVAAVSDCPSTDASLKDGFAVVSTDIAGAAEDHPVTLQVVGLLTAGQEPVDQVVAPGKSVRIMTGARIPMGADAVLSSEFAEMEHDRVTVFRDAHPGRNILEHGSDVRRKEVIIRAGTRLRPAHIGLLAAAGVRRIPVFRQPDIVIVATGSELVQPGDPIGSGKVAASNLVTLQAALRNFGIEPRAVIIHDDLPNLRQQMEPLLAQCDVMLTCGGVLDGDKDLTMRAMDLLAVEPVFRRVRVGPGKGICFGRRNTALVFNLPGGPPSNHVAFLLLALPGILRLAGYRTLADREAYRAELTCPVRGQSGWTEIFYGIKVRQGEKLLVIPIRKRSRLMAMAAADCLIELPEEMKEAHTGELVRIWKIR